MSFFCSNFDLLPHGMGSPSKVQSHCAAHMQIWDFFVSASLRSAYDYRVPSSPTYRNMPRKNSGIRGLSLRTEGALGSAVFEGHIRYPHGPRALYNRRIYSAQQKNP